MVGRGREEREEGEKREKLFDCKFLQNLQRNLKTAKIKVVGKNMIYNFDFGQKFI
jgi:hypothetical protein